MFFVVYDGVVHPFGCVFTYPKGLYLRLHSVTPFMLRSTFKPQYKRTTSKLLNQSVGISIKRFYLK